MILSDHSIRDAVAAGRIVIDPLDESLIQPSSVDVRLDRLFRVFRNHTAGIIDVKEDLSCLTELVEIPEDGVFMLHPGEFVLGSTTERVVLPDDVVARIEGKSSLGRLGLLIHSSLPADEPLLVLDGDGLALRTIGELVKEPRPCRVVAFDPETLQVGFHEVTGLYAGPSDRIYHVRLASGRSVNVTAGHNLFTLDRSGNVRRVPTFELTVGTMVAIPRSIPEAPEPLNRIDVLKLVPESERRRLMIEGKSVQRLFKEARHEVSRLVGESGYSTAWYYLARGRLPWEVAVKVPRMIDQLGRDDFIGRRGERHVLPARMVINEDLAWMLGMYVAEGHRRAKQVTISTTNQAFLDRLVETFASLGLRVYRSAGAVTCCCSLLGDLLGWLGTGDGAATKRVPPIAFGWPDHLLQAFLDGVVEGDGSFGEQRTSIWTTSCGLVADLLVVFARLGRRAGCCVRYTSRLPLWQVYAPTREHKLLTTVPLPDELLRQARQEAGLSQAAAATAAGYRHATDLNNIERRFNRDAVRWATLRRLREVYRRETEDSATMERLDALIDGGVAWDRVVEVVDTGRVEPVYDLEVRPSGRKIENFLAGRGGVFVSNTAGFIDPGFDGHITLELANVASLPITLYPGMKIGQLSFMQMTTPADHPYGKGAIGSKYQGQRGPTPSRYYQNFE